ncbi:hypothetical protein EVA_17561, partial [gut metagenome]
ELAKLCLPKRIEAHTTGMDQRAGLSDKLFIATGYLRPHIKHSHFNHRHLSSASGRKPA